MKKNFGLVLGCIAMFFSLGTRAQSYFDEALIFSRINPGGSARIQAMGGAQVALGGDYSTAFTNPAGLGFYNRSEGTLSIGTNFNNISSTLGSYLNGTTTNLSNGPVSDSKSNFNIPGFSIVLHSDKSNGKMISGNFAISLTRTNNFNQNISYSGTNPYNSLIDYFIAQSNGNKPFDNGYYPSQFQSNGASYYSLSRLAFNNFLIGPANEVTKNADSSQYHTYVDQIPLQQEQAKITGAQNQVNFAYGLNYNDLFYLGFAVGLPSFNYHSTRTYQEQFPGGPLYGFTLSEDYTIKGSGINATIGAIVRPKDFIQFGISIATPTYFYSIADSYSATLSSGWNNYKYVDVTYTSNTRTLDGGYTDSFGDPLLANYTLATPWRIRAGATVFIAKAGLITADVESVNYSKSSLTSQTDGLDFAQDNADIKTFYGKAMNIRLGGEYRLLKKYRIRAGYSLMPDPYAFKQYNIDNAITGISGGLGYRTDKFFVDLGVIQSQWNAPYVVYHYTPQTPVANLQTSNLSVMVTVGFNM
ncbi:transporter [Cytophagales bacterium WSM2-2]|nr:transporter [Cytophagales bacterium WSM2-2]